MIRLGEKYLDFSRPRIMGIINITPDSFFAGSRIADTGRLVAQVEQMVAEGVDLVDIGGQSTRPGSQRVMLQEERERVIPAIREVRLRFPDLPISVDTYYAAIAEEAVEAGATLVNDISAGSLDSQMISTVARLNVPYILMHMQGVPETMQAAPSYSNVVTDVLDFLMRHISECRRQGITDIIVDPGWGFGKNMHQNFLLLHHLRAFTVTGCPLLAGLSRKGMVYKTLGVEPEQALNGTTALHMAALLGGALMLRVHDVREARETITLFMAMKNAASEEAAS